MANFNFFTISEHNTQYGKIAVSYPVASKSGEGNGIIDVHGLLRWSNRGNIDEVPAITLEEYSLDFSRWASNITAITAALEQADKEGRADPYLKLYKGKRTDFKYILPYLIKPGDSIRGTITNEWQDLDTAGAVSSLLGGTAGDILKKMGTALIAGGGQFSAGFGTEPLKTFKSTGDNKILISFPLYNTYSIKEARDNFSFVNLLAFQNLKTRTSFVSYLPPKIYNVFSTNVGSVYMAAAYISELRIDSIGTTRAITDVGASKSNVLIPEAYKVTITLTDLLTQSSNVMWSSLEGDRVQVIDPANNNAQNGGGQNGGGQNGGGQNGKPPVTIPEDQPEDQ